jgi:hypothetical protein
MNGKKKQRSEGFISTGLVIVVGVVMLAGLAIAYRSNVQSMDTQSRSQVKIDYSQKEEAVLQALLNIVPNKAIGAMKNGSGSNKPPYSWATIFDEAITLANAEATVTPAMLQSIGGTGAILANSGDGQAGTAVQFVNPLVGAGTTYRVNAGSTRDTALLGDPTFGEKLPAPLLANNTTNHNLDRTYPIITSTKTHSGSHTKGIYLSASTYPQFNLIDYPDIRFGYAKPGDRFVAKRNWWTFSLTFGSATSAQTGVPPIKRHYLLSIYEVPSQLPISASEFMSVGSHADGSPWQNANINGGLFAGRLESEGDITLGSGLFSARRSVGINGTATIGGNVVASNFNEMGARELREAQTGSDFYDVSSSGNVGKAAFIPLNLGQEFLKLNTDGAASTRISPTGWNTYACGGTQARMRVEVRTMASPTDQTPTSIRFYYRNTSGSTVNVTYTRGSNWPTEAQSGGNLFPFQTEMLPVGRRALVVYLNRIPTFLSTISGAANVTVNNSILIYPNSTLSGVIAPSYPSIDADLAVSMRGAGDLSAYTKGFSMLTNLRLYVADSVNTVPITQPAGSGLPVGELFYPPISLFAPEKRFGEIPDFVHPVNFTGQLGSLQTDSAVAFRPLDLKSGGGGAVNPNRIVADLRPMKSPAELPPIFLINWLVTIEQIQPPPKVITTGSVVAGGNGGLVTVATGSGSYSGGGGNPNSGSGSSFTGTTPEQVRDFGLDLAALSPGSPLATAMGTVAGKIDAGVNFEAQSEGAAAAAQYASAIEDIQNAAATNLLPQADATAMMATLQAWVDLLAG